VLIVQSFWQIVLRRVKTQSHAAILACTFWDPLLAANHTPACVPTLETFFNKARLGGSKLRQSAPQDRLLNAPGETRIDGTVLLALLLHSATVASGPSVPS
jgi:hypothetical protein